MVGLENAAEYSLDRHLLDDFQRNFPLCPAPFAELAARLGIGEGALLHRLEQLRREGRIARVGAVFAPKLIGASTLAAMAVPSQRVAAISRVLERFPEVHHVDQREHHYNLWFVVTAGSDGRLLAAIGALEQATGLPVLQLPLLGEYRAGGDSSPSVGAPVFGSPALLNEIERRLVMALQEGLPLFIRPFAVLASRVGCDEAEVIARIRAWCAQGIIKRFGVVLRHPDAGDGSQAMLVHDIPDAELDRCGERLAKEPGVALCYRRVRVLPDWPYNLFCAVHGASRAALLASVAELRSRLGLTAYRCEVLFASVRPQGASAPDR